MTTDPTIIDTAGGARGKVRRSRRRRRPSGAAPPLPRSIGTTGKVWLVACGVLLVWLVFVLNTHWARRLTDQVDAALLRGNSTPAYRVAHPDHERHRPGRLGLGGDK